MLVWIYSAGTENKTCPFEHSTVLRLRDLKAEWEPIHLENTEFLDCQCHKYNTHNICARTQHICIYLYKHSIPNCLKWPVFLTHHLAPTMLRIQQQLYILDQTLRRCENGAISFSSKGAVLIYACEDLAPQLDKSAAVPKYRGCIYCIFQINLWILGPDSNIRDGRNPLII